MSKLSRLVPVLVLVGMFCVAGVTRAAPWAVVADGGNRTGTVSTIDMRTTPPTVYGPFLAGQLGTNGGGLFDVVITPNGRFALVSGFGDSTVYGVDISNPRNPVLAGQTNIGFFAEDMAMSSKGEFALITDGGFSPTIAILDMKTIGVSIYTSPTNSLEERNYFQCIALAPDDRTVLMADYPRSAIVYGMLNAERTGLVFETAIAVTSIPPYNAMEEWPRPINVAISPDGKTAIAACVGTNAVLVFEIRGPGDVVPGSTPVITDVANFANGSQSVVFSPDGKKAYVLCQPRYPETIEEVHVFGHISCLNINGPGNVTLAGADVAQTFAEGTSQLFGVDVLGVTPDGKKLLASNNTLSGGSNLLAVVDLTTYAVTSLDSKVEVPTGIGMTKGTSVLNDFDGDRVGDLVWQLPAGPVACWLMNPDLTKKGGIAISTWPTMWRLGAVGDIDRDEVPDLVWQLPDGRVALWFMNADGTKKAGVNVTAAASSWQVRGAGDMDADGIPDLIWQLPTGQVACWFMNADGTKKAGVNVTTVASSWQVRAAGDVDGDGIADLVWQLPAGQVACWFMNADGTKKAGVNVSPAASPWQVRSVSDVDADGNGDLIWQRPTGQVYCWSMNADGTPRGGAFVVNATTLWLIRR